MFFFFLIVSESSFWQNDLMKTTWWKRLDDEDDLMMKTTWWWKRFDDKNNLLMKWWIYAAIKSFYLILSNLRFRTISRVEFERRTIAKTRLSSSNKNFCSTRELNRVELFDMFETQLCDQSNRVKIQIEFLVMILLKFIENDHLSWMRNTVDFA